MAARWILVRDEDAHWYCMPADMIDTFESMLHESAVDEGCEFNCRFEEYRIDSPSSVTFENPRIWE